MQEQIIIVCQQATTGIQGACSSGYVEQTMTTYLVTSSDSLDYVVASGYFSFGLFMVVSFYVLGKSLGSIIKLVR